MTPEEYVEQAVRTKSDIFMNPFAADFCAQNGHLQVDELHAIVGLSTEAGELLDAVKKNMFYGKPIDHVNLDEEFGDSLWYVALYCHARGISITSLMQQNIDKLRVRFPHRFEATLANERDLLAERNSLESRLAGSEPRS